MRPTFQEVLPLYQEYGVQGAATRLRCRARTISAVLNEGGVHIRRGRRRNSALQERDARVRAMRAAKASHAEIAAAIQRSVSLVRRILRPRRQG